MRSSAAKISLHQVRRCWQLYLIMLLPLLVIFIFSYGPGKFHKILYYW